MHTKHVIYDNLIIASLRDILQIFYYEQCNESITVFTFLKVGVEKLMSYIVLGCIACTPYN